MSVYKEGFHAIKLIQQNSKRIFNDAADYGALVKKGDELWNWTKQLVDSYGVKASKTVNRYETGASCSCIVKLMNEHTDGKERLFRVEFIKSSARELKGYAGFVNIEEL